jgi:hypothetical protein
MFDTTPSTYVNSKSPVEASPSVAGCADASHVNVTFPAKADADRPSTAPSATTADGIFMQQPPFSMNDRKRPSVIMIP